MTLPLFAVGVISVLGQVVLLRELNVALFGVELTYALAMAVWLLWSAIGAMAGPRQRIPRKASAYRIFAAFAPIFFGCLLLIRYFRIWVGGTAGTFLPFPVQLALILISLMPAGVIMGLLFQWCAKILVADGGRLSRAYAMESAGGVAGGVAATLCFMGRIQNLTAAWLCVGLAAAVWIHGDFRGNRRLAMAVILIFVLAAGGFRMRHLDAATTRWNHPDLVAMRDSPYGRLTLTKRSNQYVLFENDVLGFESQSVDAESLAHLAALCLKRIDTAAVLGGGMEGLLQELLRHRPRAVDYVELDAALISLTRRHLPETWTAVLRHPSVRVIENDPRRFFRTAGRYDLILVGMPQPDTGAANRFYTREFFRLCRTHLTPGGVLAFRLQASENLWSPLMARRNAAVWQALTADFPHAAALPGAALVVLAAKGAALPGPETMVRRLEERGIRPRLVSAPYIRYLFTNDRFHDLPSILNAAGTPPNTDARPISYHCSALVWLSKFFPTLMHRPVSDAAHAAAATVAFLAFGIAAWGCRRHPRRRDAFWMGAAGFVGMVLETLVLLHYQAVQGVLYQNIGVLITSFMAGLWIGATATPRLLQAGKQPASIGHLCFALLAVSALVPAGMSVGDVSPNLVSAAALLLAIGTAVAGIFVVASAGSPTEQQRAASVVYAADLAGGCIGAVAGSLWLIPFWGMIPTAAAMAGLSLSALLLRRP